MKIRLIYPYFLEERIHTYDIHVPPMGIYYVGAMLKEHHYDVQIYNWHDAHKARQTARDTLMRDRPDIIGFSILHANRWGGIDIAKLAKEIDPQVNIVFGGIGATFLWEHLLTHFPVIDYIVLGEGEISFLKLVRAIDEGAADSIMQIPGIAHRRQGKPERTASPEPIQNLDSLPNPAKYFNYQHVAFTRGCPGKCAFCSSPRFWGSQIRTHSPQYFVDQLELLHQKGIHFFYFSDDTFTFKKSWVEDICRDIIVRKLQITWVAIARVNHIQADTLAWMRKAGCIQISFGIESGSEKIRQTLNKPLRRDQIKFAFEQVTSFGMMPRAYFIYGSPGESEDTIQDSIELIRAIKPLGMITYILDIFPGTRMYEKLCRQGRITEDIWLQRNEDLLYFELDDHLNHENILAYGNALRNAFYQALPGFIDDIQLIDDPGYDRLHADFYSRLAMTFSHGDYAKIDVIPNKAAIAETLFQKALRRHPDHRAYLGLGVLYQQQGRVDRSIQILDQGLDLFDSRDLSVCQGINHMNTGQFEKALSYFLDYQDQKQVRTYIAKCHEAMAKDE